MTKARSLSDFIESDGSVTLVDNQQIKIGTGNDLVLKHTGSNSVIHNTTGQLRVRSDNLLFSSYSNEEPYITATENGAVTLYHDNSAKLATTSTGIDVTGTATMDGLTVNGSEVLFDNTGGDFTLKLHTNAVSDKNEIIMGDTGTPLAKFGVSGTANDIITGSDGQDFNIGTAGGGRAINFSTDNFASVEMKLDGGKLGIGTDSPQGLIDLTVSQAKTTTSGATFAQLGKTNESSNYAALQCEVKGGASAADRKWEFQTIEQGVANAGNIVFQPSGGNVGVGCSTVGNSTLEVRSTGVDGTFANAIGFQYSGNANEANTISTSVSSNASQSGFKFNVSDGGGSSGKTNVATFLRNQIIFNEDSNDQDFRVESNGKPHMLFVDGGNNRLGIGTDSPNDIVDIHAPNSQLRITDTDDSKFVQFSYSGGKLIVRNNSTNTAINQFTLTEDGKFGIGNISPIAPLMVQGDAGGAQFTALALRQDDPDGDNSTSMTCDIDFYLWDSNTRENVPQGRIGLSSVDVGSQPTEASGILSFYTTNIAYPNATLSERLRITNNGRQKYNASAIENGHGNFVGEVGSSFKALSFSRTVGGAEVGSVVTNSSSTSYNTSSDYRIKENVNYDFDATTRLKQLKPARFNFTADSDTIVDGFLAHEVQDLVPEAISGEKDAMTSEVLYVEGNTIPEGKEVGDVRIASEPLYQGIDQSKLVPLLVKTVQELEARIALLEEQHTDSD